MSATLPSSRPITGSYGYGRIVRDGEWVRFVIRFEVLDVARFREMADAMVAVSRDEPGTVVYDWYLDEAGEHRDAVRGLRIV